MIPSFTPRLVGRTGYWRDETIVKSNLLLTALLCGASAVMPYLVVADASQTIDPADQSALAAAGEDTFVVSTDRVTIQDVIEAIGRRMQLEDARMDDVEFTTLTTVVLREVPGSEDPPYTVEEYATRHRFSREDGEQTAQLWKRTREYLEDGTVDEEVRTDTKFSWSDTEESFEEALPFMPGAGGNYRYEILERREVGNTIIYQVRFEPKSRFAALPAGVVWVDYSHWVILKLEASMTEVVPFPMFLDSIPVYRQSRERFGPYWFTTDVYMRILLQKIPFADMPLEIEVRVDLLDVLINGEPCDADTPVPPNELYGNLDPDEFWVSPEASRDSLNTYWDGIREQWESEISIVAAPVELPAATIDSLSRAGAVELQSLREGGVWKLTLMPVAPGYNRVQGPVVRGGLRYRRVGPYQPEFSASAGYAFCNQRPTFSAAAEIPLLRSRWTVADSEERGSRYTLLGLNLSGWKDVELFAGDSRRHTRSLTAFTYGSDPNQYYESRGVSAELNLRLARRLRARGGGRYVEHRSQDQQTGWNLLGRSLRPDGNLSVTALDDRAAYVGLNWSTGPLTLDGTLAWHRARSTDFESGASDTRRDLQELDLKGEFDWIDPLGNNWVLRGNYRSLSEQGPRQWRTWLGDHGTLRGYPAAELTGDAGWWSSVDLRLDFDLWRALHFPVLKNMRWQPLLFADMGRTWNQTGPWPTEGTQAGRLDLGFGFGKRMDIPGVRGLNKLRLYAAHPVGDGSDGRGWRFLIALEK